MIAKRIKLRLDYCGAMVNWYIWRDAALNHWLLLTDDGCERVLESRWVDSVPRVRTIAENYGCTITQSLS